MTNARLSSVGVSNAPAASSSYALLMWVCDSLMNFITYAHTSSTGFASSPDNVWGRPVDVAFAKDGALLFTDDGNGVIYRVSYKSK